MPYASKAQAGYFHAAEARGDMPHSVVSDFDKASKGRMGHLPEHVRHASGGLMHAECPRCGHHFAAGGEVDDSEYAEDIRQKNADYEHATQELARPAPEDEGKRDWHRFVDDADRQVRSRDEQIVKKSLGGFIARRNGSDEDGTDEPYEYERERRLERDDFEDTYNQREDGHFEGARHFAKGGRSTKFSLAAHLAERGRRPVLTGSFSKRDGMMTRGGGAGYPTDDQGDLPPPIAPYARGGRRMSRGGLARHLARRYV